MLKLVTTLQGLPAKCRSRQSGFSVLCQIQALSEVLSSCVQHRHSIYKKCIEAWEESIMLCQYFRWYKPRRCVTQVSRVEMPVCLATHKDIHAHSGLAYNRPYLNC